MREALEMYRFRNEEIFAYSRERKGNEASLSKLGLMRSTSFIQGVSIWPGC